MRAAALPVLALPLLLTYCGAKHELVIGEVTPPIVAMGGTSVIPNAGVGGEPSSAGSSSGGLGGNAGSGGDTAGSSTVEAGAPPIVGSTGGEGGSPAVCPTGEEPPLGSLLHRYGFDGDGTEVLDSIGDAHGDVIATSLDDTGLLTLAGSPSRELANLPNGLISDLSEVTLVVWTTWKGGAGYERIIDFGISDQGEVQGGSGRSYIAVMTSNGFANGTGLGAEITAPGFATLQLASDADIDGIPSMVALSFRSGISVGLFLDAQLLIESPTPIKLSDISDVNNWLGQSQWSKDHNYGGTYDEFRIYNAALSECQLSTIYARGPTLP
ncbi:MAG TPA: LamG-like jellyroll fold domain-containing protein [Polyangiaceae bacterium]